MQLNGSLKNCIECADKEGLGKYLSYSKIAVTFWEKQPESTFSRGQIAFFREAVELCEKRIKKIGAAKETAILS